ncbi:MAG: DUF5615 family PIN-like protein [Flavobacteriales bacterium]
MKVIVDMCLSPQLALALQQAGHEAEHWASIGPPKASDTAIMEHALESGSIVLTHDLDFGDLLFLTNQSGPSVIIVRGSEMHPEVILEPILHALTSFAHDLERGALIVLARNMARVRELPLR